MCMLSSASRRAAPSKALPMLYFKRVGLYI